MRKKTAKKSKKPVPAGKPCLKIQWSQLTVDDKGNPVCPSCKEPAEMVIGMIGPCWAHK